MVPCAKGHGEGEVEDEEVLEALERLSRRLATLDAERTAALGCERLLRERRLPRGRWGREGRQPWADAQHTAPTQGAARQHSAGGKENSRPPAAAALPATRPAEVVPPGGQPQSRGRPTRSADSIKGDGRLVSGQWPPAVARPTSRACSSEARCAPLAEPRVLPGGKPAHADHGPSEQPAANDTFRSYPQVAKVHSHRGKDAGDGRSSWVTHAEASSLIGLLPDGGRFHGAHSEPLKAKPGSRGAHVSEATAEDYGADELMAVDSAMFESACLELAALASAAAAEERRVDALCQLDRDQAQLLEKSRQESAAGAQHVVACKEELEAQLAAIHCWRQQGAWTTRRTEEAAHIDAESVKAAKASAEEAQRLSAALRQERSASAALAEELRGEEARCQHLRQLLRSESQRAAQLREERRSWASQQQALQHMEARLGELAAAFGPRESLRAPAGAGRPAPEASLPAGGGPSGAPLAACRAEVGQILAAAALQLSGGPAQPERCSSELLWHACRLKDAATRLREDLQAFIFRLCPQKVLPSESLSQEDVQPLTSVRTLLLALHEIVDQVCHAPAMESSAPVACKSKHAPPSESERPALHFDMAARCAREVHPALPGRTTVGGSSRQTCALSAQCKAQHEEYHDGVAAVVHQPVLQAFMGSGQLAGVRSCKRGSQDTPTRLEHVQKDVYDRHPMQPVSHKSASTPQAADMELATEVLATAAQLPVQQGPLCGGEQTPTLASHADLVHATYTRDYGLAVHASPSEAALTQWSAKAPSHVAMIPTPPRAGPAPSGSSLALPKDLQDRDYAIAALRVALETAAVGATPYVALHERALRPHHPSCEEEDAAVAQDIAVLIRENRVSNLSSILPVSKTSQSAAAGAASVAGHTCSPAARSDAEHATERPNVGVDDSTLSLSAVAADMPGGELTALGTHSSPATSVPTVPGEMLGTPPRAAPPRGSCGQGLAEANSVLETPPRLVAPGHGGGQLGAALGDARCPAYPQSLLASPAEPAPGHELPDQASACLKVGTCLGDAGEEAAGAAGAARDGLPGQDSPGECLRRARSRLVGLRQGLRRVASTPLLTTMPAQLRR